MRGIGAIHLMVNKLGLRQEIDSRLHLLKKHLPYHESDHVLNLTYNALLEGVRLEDIELRRNDEAFLDGLGAQRIPDPTLARWPSTIAGALQGFESLRAGLGKVETV